MKLAEAMNTYNLALHLIKERNYSIKLELDDQEEEILYWVAQKDKRSIYASNPLSLLSLVVIAETYGEAWNKVEIPQLYDEILEKNIL